MEEREAPRISTEESSPVHIHRSSSTLISDSSRTSEIGIYELSFPGACIIMDRIDSEVVTQKMTFKAWVLYADTERIFDELKRRLRENGQMQFHLPANICTDRKKARYFPPIKLGNITKLTLDTNSFEDNDSNVTFVTIDGESKVFTKESIKKPSEILKGINEEEWPKQSLPSIPSFQFTFFINSHVKCEAVFQIHSKSDNDPETVYEYVTYVDNNHTKHKDPFLSEINGSQMIDIHRGLIIKYMEDMDTVITKLAEAGIIDEKEKINLCNPNNDRSIRIGELLTILMQRWHGFQPLIFALRETGLEKNKELANRLE